MGDGRTGNSGDLVLRREIKIIGSKGEGRHGALVLGENAGSDVNEIVEKYTTDRHPSEVLLRFNFDTTEWRVVRFVGPDQKTPEGASHFILKRPEPTQMQHPLIERLVKADGHRCC